MDFASRSPLVECFRQGGVPVDVRLQAARGGLSLQVHQQLQLLMILAFDPDNGVAEEARTTINRLPEEALAALIASPDMPADIKEFYADLDGLARGGGPAGRRCARAPVRRGRAPSRPGRDTAAPADQSVADLAADIEADPERRGTAQRLAMLTVAERIKVAMQGSREERSVLVRDPNRLVSSAVLSSPKLTESEVEAIARMTNVSDEVLRILGHNRTWTKNYGVISALTRNPKTPVAVALTLLPRLLEREVKVLSTDRNVPEPIRLLGAEDLRRAALHGGSDGRDCRDQAALQERHPQDDRPRLRPRDRPAQVAAHRGRAREGDGVHGRAGADEEGR